jgi:SAM-dependent methyltransferase
MNISVLFMKFVEDIRRFRIQKTNDPRDESGLVPVFVSFESKSEFDARRTELIRQSWSELAPNWVFQESDLNYQVILHTLLDFLPADLLKRRETKIVSLGAGPGIYEIFLAWLLNRLDIGKFQFIISDYAPGMIDFQRELINESGIQILDNFISNLASFTHPLVANMEDLPEECEDASIVICNNSIQWTDNWRRVIGEISRILIPDGNLMLTVHPHPMSIQRGGEDGEKEIVFEWPIIYFDDLLDEMAEHSLEPADWRMIMANGMGQAGRPVNRQFFSCFKRPDKEISWRENKAAHMIHKIVEIQRELWV